MGLARGTLADDPDVTLAAGILAEAEMGPLDDLGHLDAAQILVRSHGSFGPSRNDAELAFRKVLRLSPGRAEAHLRLGHVLYLLDRSAEARREFDAVLGANPETGDRFSAYLAALFLGRLEEELTGVSLAVTSAVRPLVILFTDGQEDASWTSRANLLECLRRSEAVVDVVWAPGDLPAAKVNALRSVASETGGSFLNEAEGANVVRQLSQMVDEFRSRYLLIYSPRGVEAKGDWHKLTVRVRDRAARVQARAGYYARPARRP